MRVSEHYRLNRSQPTLDFVDVDVAADLTVFVDPRALRLLPSTWGDECVSLIQDFFRTILHLLREARDAEGRAVLRVLREPNETHLGLSRGRSRGRALGSQSSYDVWEVLRSSQAVQSGLLEDLEDTILLVDGIADDIISDITTNIIRQPLIQYTQAACGVYGIPLAAEVDSGPLWDPASHSWHSTYVQLPTVAGSRLLLVPKAIVRRRMDYNSDEYYRHYILETLQEVELAANTELVQLLKNGQRRVSKKDLEKKYGRGKSVNVRETLRHPDVLRRYRDDKARIIRAPLSHDELAENEGTQPPDWDALLRAVLQITAGTSDATSYHRAVEALLSALFYPALCNPQIEFPIHDGRKRIDITYTNFATGGFFRWLAANYAAAHVFVECKNYGREVGNPELDQLAGRFSPSRGQFGILVCRTFENKELFFARCRDTASDQRGLILALDDGDLIALTAARKGQDRSAEFALLKGQFDRLIM